MQQATLKPFKLLKLFDCIINALSVKSPALRFPSAGRSASCYLQAKRGKKKKDKAGKQAVVEASASSASAGNAAAVTQVCRQVVCLLEGCAGTPLCACHNHHEEILLPSSECLASNQCSTHQTINLLFADVGAFQLTLAV